MARCAPPAQQPARRRRGHRLGEAELRGSERPADSRTRCCWGLEPGSRGLCGGLQGHSCLRRLAACHRSLAAGSHEFSGRERRAGESSAGSTGTLGTDPLRYRGLLCCELISEALTTRPQT